MDFISTIIISLLTNEGGKTFIKLGVTLFIRAMYHPGFLTTPLQSGNSKTTNGNPSMNILKQKENIFDK